jgi:Carbohydrate family 9 binding domain-like
MQRDIFTGLAVAILIGLFGWMLNTRPDFSVPARKATAATAPLTALYGTPVVDGLPDDDLWKASGWYPIDQVWMGKPAAPEDFYGRFKVAWDENNLYILAEIVDDSLADTHPDGLQGYPDDDCLEILLDEDASGGDHTYNYNAFAYHIGLDGQVVDFGPDEQPHYYTEHCTVRRVTEGNISYWEVALQVFDGNHYTDGGENIPKLLRAAKRMGFAVAYCDADRMTTRDNFFGSVPIAGPDKNLTWRDAGVFGLLELAE